MAGHSYSNGGVIERCYMFYSVVFVSRNYPIIFVLYFVVNIHGAGDGSGQE